MLSFRSNDKIEAPAWIIKKLLNEQEIRCYEKQKVKQKRTELKLNKASKEKDYIKNIWKIARQG